MLGQPLDEILKSISRDADALSYKKQLAELNFYSKQNYYSEAIDSLKILS